MTVFWTVVLGSIGSILGGCVTHVIARPKNERYTLLASLFYAGRDPDSLRLLQAYEPDRVRKVGSALKLY